MNKTALLLTAAFSLLLMAPIQYRRDLNGNINVYQNNIRQYQLRPNYFGYREYNRYGQYQRSYYGRWGYKP